MASTEHRGFFIEEEIDKDGKPTGRFFFKDRNGNVCGPYDTVEEAKEAIDDYVDANEPPPPRPRPRP